MWFGCGFRIGVRVRVRIRVRVRVGVRIRVRVGVRVRVKDRYNLHIPPRNGAAAGPRYVHTILCESRDRATCLRLPPIVHKWYSYGFREVIHCLWIAPLASNVNVPETAHPWFIF